MTPRRIYLASSWRNEHQPRIVALLREAGHEVYDFRNPPRATGFSWREVDPYWVTWTPAEYIAGLQHPRAEEGFRSDFDAMQWADTCVLLLPPGASAALEAGWSKGSGRRVIVHVAGLREPDLMYKVADAFTLTDDELLRAVDEGPRPTDRQIELHRLLMGWYHFRCHGLGSPTVLPDVPLDELIVAQRAVAAWSPRKPDGARVVHFRIDESALALEWGAAQRAGYHLGADGPVQVTHDRTTATIELQVETEHTRDGSLEVLLGVGDAREVAWRLLGAVGSMLEVTDGG